ncbi:BrnT family toxin [Candidatus Acetothermia bacterium]|nr:BrnT family toxin [Candidatus Acetothermia bacterium]
MEVHELTWDARNIEHIAEHQVVPSEVEELIFEDAPHYRRGSGEATYHVYGQSGAGRYLFVVLRYLGRNRGKVVTARNTTVKEKRLYLRIQRGEYGH